SHMPSQAVSLWAMSVCKIGPGQSQAADCGHRELAARPELVRPRRVRGEPRTRPLQPNLASGLSRERVEGRLALALRRLVSRHMVFRLVLVRFRFLFFLISFLSLRHGTLLFVHLTRHSSTAMEQFELYFSGASTITAVLPENHIRTY